MEGNYNLLPKEILTMGIFVIFTTVSKNGHLDVSTTVSGYGYITGCKNNTKIGFIVKKMRYFKCLSINLPLIEQAPVIQWN